MCTFCSTASFFQRSFRLKSAGRLVTELDRLHVRYGFSDFKLDHDLFTVNRRKVLEFCEAVQDRGYRWRASARVDCVDAELLNKMAEAGCVALYFGIETGSARMQQIAKKRLDLSLVEPTLELAQHLGIQTTASFITGYPEEREQDQEDTLDLLGRCFRPSCVPQLHILAPEPGTPMFEQFGDKLQYDGYAGPYNARLIGLDDERYVREHPDIFPTYHYYPAAMPRARHTFAAETIDVLRRLGPIVLGYTLRFYGGRLSRLVRALRRWGARHETGNRVDADLVEAYVSARFGRRHHLTSLIRYALRVHPPDAEQRFVLESRAPAFDRNQTYRLGSHTYVLPDLHDCGALLHRIERDPNGSRPFDDTQAGERGVYLLSVSGATATSYRIDPGVQAILSLFDEPRTCSDVVGLIRTATGVGAIDDRFFESLVTARILVAASRDSAAVARATTRRHLDVVHG
jgi:hypothetical protein